MPAGSEMGVLDYVFSEAPPGLDQDAIGGSGWRVSQLDMNLVVFSTYKAFAPIIGLEPVFTWLNTVANLPEVLCFDRQMKNALGRGYSNHF